MPNSNPHYCMNSRCCSRMEWLIDVLLKLSRLDAGTIKFENKPFSVEKLVQQATAPFDIMLDIKNIKMDISDIEEFNYTVI